jgi:peroxiredoxin
LLVPAGFAVAEDKKGLPDTAALAKTSFRDVAEKKVAWTELAKDRAAVVVVFLSFDCPMSNGYSTLLTELAKTYAEKKIAFVGLCPCDDDVATIAKLTAEYRLNFPVFKDDKLAAANALQATHTPMAFVIDAQGSVRYQGLIDNRYAARLKENQRTTEHYLKDALDAFVGGSPVKIAATKPFGCHIVREEKRVAAGAFTYHRDVAPILQNRCQSCHRPGEVGPFSLMTYKQASNWADDIKEYTQNRRMPPWKPVPSAYSFSGERRLSDRELEVLAKWADDGAPEGDPKDAPPTKKFEDGWQLGKPDLILTPNEDFVLGATGKDHFRVIVMSTGLTEDKYVTAIEIRPGNPRVVHHTLNFWDTTGSARARQQEEHEKRVKNPPAPDAVDVGPGYASAMGLGFQIRPQDLMSGKPPIGTLAGWAPGIMPKELPAGTGYYLPKNSDLVVQMHYHRNGRVERDRTQFGLYFAKKPVEKPMTGVVVTGRFKTDAKATGRFAALGYIPAGDDHFTARGAMVTMEDCVVHAVTPHMHLLGKAVKITMTPPNGKPEVLINIPEWDYNWQETYFLKQSIPVKAGTRFDIEAVFDNSAKNPNNPSSPPIDVTFGEQTTNEMLFGFVAATKDRGVGLSPYIILFRPVGDAIRPKGN